MDRENVIQKITEEKGIESIPVLLDLLEKEDEETKNLIFEVLSYMGNESVPILMEEFKKRFETSEKDDVVLLYLMEMLGEMEIMEIVPYLERMLNRYTDERAFPIIIEHLWKLTGDLKYLSILETFLDEDEETEEIAIMAISQKADKKVIDILVEKYNNAKSNSKRALILDSLTKVLFMDFDLVPYLKEKSKEISDRVQWYLKNFSK
ncbi:MAG TPA: hypothetical protein PLS66_00350 [Tepiditoga sp.]|nr:hypothetical protein [Thermotogota bacterium]HOO73716.1 hypothetical protein [Tepiditoga sp.]